MEMFLGGPLLVLCLSPINEKTVVIEPPSHLLCPLSIMPIVKSLHGALWYGCIWLSLRFFIFLCSLQECKSQLDQLCCPAKFLNSPYLKLTGPLQSAVDVALIEGCVHAPEADNTINPLLNPRFTLNLTSAQYPTVYICSRWYRWQQYSHKIHWPLNLKLSSADSYWKLETINPLTCSTALYSHDCTLMLIKLKTLI